MKIILFDPNKDLPVKTIRKILREGVELYQSGLN
jgi:predicted RNA binding protein YcfA (HicA-like mRNA interferase family)